MIHQPKDRDEWLALRKTVVTSTEISALFGRSPYMTALELALVKTGQIEDTFRENQRTKWGTRLESKIAEGIAEDYGVLADSLNIFATAENCRIGASFDWGIHFVNDNKIDDERLRVLLRCFGIGLLEIKNVDRLVYRDEWDEDEAPDHIELQLQHQLECSGREWGVIAALVGGNDPHIIIRQRDRAVGSAIRTVVNKFWTNLDAGIMPPAVMPADADVIRRLYNYAEPEKILDAQTDTSIAELCGKYVDAHAAVKSAEDIKDSYRAELLMRVKDAEIILVPGYSFKAAMRAPTEVKAHTRAGFRDFRLTRKKS